jgi:hypothetical protein
LGLTSNRSLRAIAGSESTGIPTNFLSRILPIASETANEFPIAVKFGENFRFNAGLAVQIVSVLGNEKLKLANTLKFG